jgi:hypothetical protein
VEAPPYPLSSRAKPRDLRFCRLVMEMFFEEAVWASRPVEPALSLAKGQTAKLYGRRGWGVSPNLHQDSVEKHFQDEPVESQIPRLRSG